MLEMLITISLMGIACVTLLVGLRSTIMASAIDRDHAVAFSWLQSASDEIYRDVRVPCTSGRPLALSTYDAAAKRAPKPPLWAGTDASIRVTNVEYLGRVNPDADFDWDASFCFEGAEYATSPLYTQRITIQTTGPGGQIVRTLQMVKSK